MSQANPEPIAVPALPPPRRRRWPRVLGIMGVFFLGVIAGGTTTAVVIRDRISWVIKHPEEVPDRVMVVLRRRLHLTPEQDQQVEQIIREHHAAIETYRAGVQPKIFRELEQVRTEVAELLKPEQRVEWLAWCDMIKERLLPAPPAKPATKEKPPE